MRRMIGFMASNEPQSETSSVPSTIRSIVLLIRRGKRLLRCGLSMETELGNFGLFFGFLLPCFVNSCQILS